MDWLESVVGKKDSSKKEEEDEEFEEDDDLEDGLGLKDDEILLNDYTEVIKVLEENPPKPSDLTEEEMEEYKKFIERMGKNEKASEAYSGKKKPKTKINY